MSGSSGLGRPEVGVGRPAFEGEELFGTNTTDTDFAARLYGLSFVLRAAAPAGTPYVTDVAVDRGPDGGDYETGDTITVGVTFSEPVSLSGTGEPTFPLDIGKDTRNAAYQSISSDGTVLTFSYEVTAGDIDHDGISITALTFDLPTGASITNGSSVDAYLGPIALSTDFGVNVPPFITGVVTSTPKATSAGDTYGQGEDIEITVTFSEAVNVEGDIDFGLSVSGAKRARLKSGSNTTELVFVYTVQAGDADTNGIFIGNHDSANATFDLQPPGQSIVGVAAPGRDARLEHNEVGTLGNRKVDGTLTGADATLSALSLSGITLDQTFTAGAAGTATTSFTATATATVSTTTVTATATRSGGSSAVVITPGDADTTAGHQVNLAADADTVITVTVTSTNGDSTRAYTITVTRQAATDSDAPAVDSATVSSDGTTIDIVFDEDLDTTGTAPAVTAFDVTVDGGTAVNPDSVAFHATDADTVTLTMATADTIAAGAAVSVTYDEPTSNALADAASNKVADFTDLTALNRPGAPAGLSLEPGDHWIEASWTAPSLDGGSAITGYRVEWRNDRQLTWEAAAGQFVEVANSPHTITGLLIDLAYWVRVRAVNAGGPGPWTAAITETGGLPVVSSAKVDIDDAKRIRVTFSSSQMNANSVPDKSVFTVTDVTADTVLAVSSVGFVDTVPGEGGGATDLLATVFVVVMDTEIVPGNSLEFDYDPPATDPLEEGQGRNVVAVTEQTVFNLPAAPTGLTLTAGDTEITASWTAPPDGGSAITGYRVEWRIADSDRLPDLGPGRDGPAVRRARLLPVHDHRRHRLRRQPHQRHLLHGARPRRQRRRRRPPERRGVGRPLRGLPGPRRPAPVVGRHEGAGAVDSARRRRRRRRRLGLARPMEERHRGLARRPPDQRRQVPRRRRRRHQRLAQLRGARREPDQRHRVHVPGPGPRRGGPHRRVDRGGVRDALASRSRCPRDRREQTGI